MNEVKFNSIRYQKHTAISAGFYLKSMYEELIPSFFDSYTGVNCMEWFSSKLAELTDTLYQKI